MSLTNIEEVKCPCEDCGEIFEANLISAINVKQNPELKELLLSGKLNVVKCPTCSTIFYAEKFLLYFDTENELIAFVYSKSYEQNSDHWKNKMIEDFNQAHRELQDQQNTKYSPVLIFGVDSLIDLIKYEQEISDEISILKHSSKNFKIELVKISPSEARKNNIPSILPRIASKKQNNIRTEIISGLETLLKHFPKLAVYRRVSEQISKDSSWDIATNRN